MTDKNPVNPKDIARLNNKIEDIRCAMQMFIVLIILILAIQILLLTENHNFLVYGWSIIISFTVAIILIIGVVSIVCTGGNQTRMETSNVQKESSDALIGTQT